MTCAQEPDPFRTAVVSALHLELTKVCGRYGTVLAALHQELLRAIYPDYKPGDCPARQNLTYEPPSTLRSAHTPLES